MKTCWKCKVEKNDEDFYKDSRQKDKKQKACKSCQTARNLVYTQNNKEYFKIKGAERYIKCLEDDPNFNKKRYEADKDGFITRVAKYRKTIEGTLKGLLNSAKVRSIKKNVAFDINFEFIKEMYKNQNGKCALTNISFTCEPNEIKGRYNKHNISLDRIKSNLGYTKNNVRLVLVCVNLALNAFGDENLELLSTEFLRTKGYTVIKNS